MQSWFTTQQIQQLAAAPLTGGIGSQTHFQYSLTELSQLRQEMPPHEQVSSDDLLRLRVWLVAGYRPGKERAGGKRNLA